MPSNFEILESIRLTGRIVDGQLQILTMRDQTEVVEALDVKSDSLPVRLECYDFTEQATGRTWEFIESGIWTRGDQGHALAQFDAYTDGDAYESLTITARPQRAESDDEDEPGDVYIKIKPIVDGPDNS